MDALITLRRGNKIIMGSRGREVPERGREEEGRGEWQVLERSPEGQENEWEYVVDIIGGRW